MQTAPVRRESRYHTDFEERRMLGEGGFGEVWMCRNRLDDQKYAIKKIRLDPQNLALNKKMLREVKTLSGLHHQNVVRYFQVGWLMLQVHTPHIKFSGIEFPGIKFPGIECPGLVFSGYQIEISYGSFQIAKKRP
jgi:serine/threonine protein kinase